MRAHLWLTLTNVLKTGFVKTNKKRVQVGSCNIINPCLCPHVMFCLLKSNKPTKHSKAQSMSESDKTSGANSKFIDEMWSSTCGVIIHNDGWLHMFSVCRKTKRSTSFWGCCRSFCNIEFCIPCFSKKWYWTCYIWYMLSPFSHRNFTCVIGDLPHSRLLMQVCENLHGWWILFIGTVHLICHYHTPTLQWALIQSTSELGLKSQVMADMRWGISI